MEKGEITWLLKLIKGLLLDIEREQKGIDRMSFI
jgi:hypothetical protein